MTREDIIWLARQAGLTGLMETGLIDCLERFANLVADVERANVTLAAFQVAERQIAAEREACAKLAESPIHRHEIAEKIRARGEG